MHSFIIISKEAQTRNTYLVSFLNQQKLQTFDIVSIEEEGAIGIECIRAVQKSLFLKPLGEKKAIVIKNADNATLQAQNALLKMLEEPPINTIIILTATKKDLLLQTILSRCQIITLSQDKDKEYKDTSVTDIFSLSIPEKLILAEKVGKQRDAALLWLENTIIAYHMQLHSNSSKDLLTVITALQQSYTTIQTTNVSPRLVLEHLFLSLLK
ncbi:MAG: hypothetical protein HY429_03905 [Candidatus Levybacteria bacterium]|nr:hypothetical protein [Candidatus Levybacteria bacterium]